MRQAHIAKQALDEHYAELREDEKAVADLALGCYDYNVRTDAQLRRFRTETRVLYVLAVLLAIAVAIVAQVLTDNQREGRAAAINVTCAAIGAVTEAGRAAIVGGGSPGNDKFTKALERLGYPPEKQRKAAARIAAQAYVANIISQVEKKSGVTGIVNKDGSLNCAKLREEANAK